MLKENGIPEFDILKIMKFSDWAESLLDDIDFIDYWYNLFLSSTKQEIERALGANINAFDWTRWREDFEEYVDRYKPITGVGFGSAARQWYGGVMQGLVYATRTKSRIIAKHYGKDVFLWIMKQEIRGHCCSLDWFVDLFAQTHGLPPGCDRIIELNM